MNNIAIFLTYAFGDEKVDAVIGALKVIVNAPIERRDSSYSGLYDKIELNNGEIKITNNKIDEGEWRFEDYKQYEKIVYVSLTKGRKKDRVEYAEKLEDGLKDIALLIKKRERVSE